MGNGISDVLQSSASSPLPLINEAILPIRFVLNMVKGHHLQLG